MLLHIDASARQEALSRELGQAFVDEWRLAHPHGMYVHRDLGRHPVPVVDEARAEIAEHAAVHGIREFERLGEAVRSAEQAASWAITKRLIEELLSADVLLIATPMYNFSVPAALKAWIDQVAFPGLSLAGKVVVVASARGGAYGPGTPRANCDFQEPYLRALFTQLGVTDLSFFHTEWTRALVSPALGAFREQHAASRDAALRAVQASARRAAGGGP